MGKTLIKEFKDDQYNIWWDGQTLEFNNGQGWTVTQGRTFWIETLRHNNIPDYAYNAMIVLGRKKLGCRYLYD